MLNFVLIYTRCFRICSPIESIYNIMVWWWRKTENLWQFITLSVIYWYIGIQCNLVILLVYIARIISETPSRKLIHHNFWFWWTFSEAIEYIICAFILPQDVQLQLKSSPRLYSFNCIIPGDRLLESLRYNISWTWSQVVENNTNNKWCFPRRHERVNHSKEFKNGGYLRWICEFLYFVDNERFRYKHYFTSNCRNMFKYLQIVSLQIVFHKYFL